LCSEAMSSWGGGGLLHLGAWGRKTKKNKREGKLITQCSRRKNNLFKRDSTIVEGGKRTESDTNVQIADVRKRKEEPRVHTRICGKEGRRRRGAGKRGPG